jgi:hypothetical protein
MTHQTELAPAIVAERARPRAATAINLGTMAVEAHASLPQVEQRLEWATERSQGVEAIAARWKHDPRFMLAYQKITSLAGKSREQRLQDAAHLESQDALNVSVVREYGHERKEVELLEQTHEQKVTVRSTSLAETRAVVRGFERGRGGACLDRMLDRASTLPAFIKNQKPADVTWQSWIGEQDGANDDQLLNVLEWHDAQERKSLNPEGKAEMAEQARNIFRDGLTEAVERGALPTAALAKLDKLEASNITFSSVFELAAMNRMGAYIPKGQILDATVILPVSMPHDTSRHELTHDVLGDFKYMQSLDPEAPIHRGDRWFDEALTQHATRMMRGEDPNELVIGGKSNQDDTYSFELELAGLVALSANANITMTTFMEGYIGDTSAKRAVRDKLSAAYGFDILGTIAENIHALYPEDDMETGRTKEGALIVQYVTELEKAFVGGPPSKQAVQDIVTRTIE